MELLKTLKVMENYNFNSNIHVDEKELRLLEQKGNGTLYIKANKLRPVLNVKEIRISKKKCNFYWESDIRNTLHVLRMEDTA